MGKEKAKSTVPNRHLHARISYLEQAAAYLTRQGNSGPEKEPARISYNPPILTPARKGTKPDPVQLSGADMESEGPKIKPSEVSTTQSGQQEFEHSLSGGLPLYFGSHLRQIARKSQIRLQASLKHTLCKRCHSTLINDQTAHRQIENLSSGGKKRHADVLTMKCNICGETKRFAIGAKRQKRKADRIVGKREDVATENEPVSKPSASLDDPAP